MVGSQLTARSEKRSSHPMLRLDGLKETPQSILDGSLLLRFNNRNIAEN
jgi:hypothetical protein